MNPKPLAALNHFTVPFSFILDLLKNSQPNFTWGWRIPKKNRAAAVGTAQPRECFGILAHTRNDQLFVEYSLAGRRVCQAGYKFLALRLPQPPQEVLTDEAVASVIFCSGRWFGREWLRHQEVCPPAGRSSERKIDRGRHEDRPAGPDAGSNEQVPGFNQAIPGSNPLNS